MPDSTPVTLIPGTLPSGYCFISWQGVFNDFFSLGTAFLPGQYRTFNYGDSEPTADDRDKPWLHLNPDGSPDRWFVYFSGAWVWPHEIPANSDERRIWVGSSVDLQTYDGGSAGAVSATTGPFWEVDTDFEGKVPVGAGTLQPSGAVVGVGDTGGVDEVELVTNQIPSHSHSTPNAFSGQIGNGASAMIGFAGTGPEVSPVGNVSTTSTGGGQAHTNMPPYSVVLFIKRTARVYRTP